MSEFIISAMSAWKDGADSANVGAAHKALAEFAREIPRVRVCRYGLNEQSRTSVVYGVYESPQALKELFDALVVRGGAIMEAELQVTQLISGQTFIQGPLSSLEAVADVIDGWGLSPSHTDSQGNVHMAL